MPAFEELEKDPKLDILAENISFDSILNVIGRPDEKNMLKIKVVLADTLDL